MGIPVSSLLPAFLLALGALAGCAAPAPAPAPAPDAPAIVLAIHVDFIAEWEGRPAHMKKLETAQRVRLSGISFAAPEDGGIPFMATAELPKNATANDLAFFLAESLEHVTGVEVVQRETTHPELQDALGKSTTSELVLPPTLQLRKIEVEWLRDGEWVSGPGSIELYLGEQRVGG